MAEIDGLQVSAGSVVVDEVLADWSVFLVTERGIKPSTAVSYLWFGRPFLLSLVVDGKFELATVTAADVSDFLRSSLTEFAPSTRTYVLSVMRSLLRFLFVSGRIPRRLDGAVLGSAGHRDAGVPRWLPVSDVALMLAACDVKTVGGSRDVAVLTVISRLGLRAAEVAGLTLDDVDWRAGTLRVAGKGGYFDVMPLPADVGEALMNYLSLAPPRPAGERALFLSLKYPVKALNTPALGQSVCMAGVRAGLGKVGPHRLRHTVATATVNAGASLEEVGQLLRHRWLGSTTIYAKVDISHLALLARPWPKENSASARGEQS